MTVKDFFWLSCSAMMLCICCSCVYYINSCELIRKKRDLLYEYYTDKMNLIFYGEEDPYNTPDAWRYVDKQIDKLKRKMHKDGFDRREIYELRKSCYLRALESYKTPSVEWEILSDEEANALEKKISEKAIASKDADCGIKN